MCIYLQEVFDHPVQSTRYECEIVADDATKDQNCNYTPRSILQVYFFPTSSFRSKFVRDYLWDIAAAQVQEVPTTA